MVRFLIKYFIVIEMSKRRVDALRRHVVASGKESSGLISGVGDAQGAYDYVVIGAGSAGCVVAARLSEDPSVSVLLVEAGGDNRTLKVQSPFVTCPTLQNSDLDWAFRTTPQEHTDGRLSYWPRGKCLGGSSSINYMLYVRGDPKL